MRAAAGRGVRLAAMPAPMPGCINRNGAATLPMPTIKRWNECRVTSPVEAVERQQNRRERDADDVVSDPADRAFTPHRRRGGNRIVAESAARQVR